MYIFGTKNFRLHFITVMKEIETPNITKEMILSHSHLPINIACCSLNTEVVTLKKICRDLGFHRWPYNARKEMNKVQKSHKKQPSIQTKIFVEYFKESQNQQKKKNMLDHQLKSIFKERDKKRYPLNQ